MIVPICTPFVLLHCIDTLVGYPCKFLPWDHHVRKHSLHRIGEAANQNSLQETTKLVQYLVLQLVKMFPENLFRKFECTLLLQDGPYIFQSLPLHYILLNKLIYILQFSFLQEGQLISKCGFFTRLPSHMSWRLPISYLVQPLPLYLVQELKIFGVQNFLSG